MSHLLESIKLTDGKFRNLLYHEQRMNRSLKALYGSNEHLDLEALLESVETPKHGLYKCRIVYGEKERMVEFVPYRLPVINTLQVLHDDRIEYAFKYTDRKSIHQLHQKRGECDDILIVKHGLVTDSSYANLLFRREEKWYTPGSPLLKGTQRAALLDRNIIEETVIAPGDIKTFDSFKLINAMLEFDAPECPISNIVF